MAWRPTDNLIEGELDNTVPGEVTGWLLFLGMKEAAKLDLVGGFHRDIRGAKICLTNPPVGWAKVRATSTILLKGLEFAVIFKSAW